MIILSTKVIKPWFISQAYEIHRYITTLIMGISATTGEKYKCLTYLID